MSYATTTDYGSFCGRPVNATSKPTRSEVEEIIELIESELEGYLRAKDYTPIPATNTADVSILKLITLTGAAAVGERHLDVERAEPYQERYDAYIKKIVEGTLEFSGALEGDELVDAPHTLPMCYGENNDIGERWFGRDTKW